MKLSLAWIFDHIQGSLKNHDIPALIARMSTTICEVEECTPVRFDVDQFVLGAVIAKEDERVMVDCPELGSQLTLAVRSDASIGKIYLIKKGAAGWQWALQTDCGNQKEGLMPALSVTPQDLKGAWKKQAEVDDYIIEIDNVSLTHRPDLWSHRGFACEIAALLNLPMVHIDEFVASVAVESLPDAKNYKSPELSLKVEDTVSCRRFAATIISDIAIEGSWFWMAHRLARVDTKVINSVVDATNYVMFDIGQPLHAFDAHKVPHHELVVRRARAGEKLTLLDGQSIDLTQENLVISDRTNSLALAGIMGGESSAVCPATSSLIVESASFLPSRIRKSSTQFRMRTDASARFEKNIDPNQNVDGLLRFIFLLAENASSFEEPSLIISLGAEQEPSVITLTHESIEKKLGLTLKPKEVEALLQRLDFEVEVLSKDPYTYAVCVPSSRALKDITIAEDVIEEIARLYGLDKIPHTLPALAKKASDLDPMLYKEAMMQFCAFAAHMNEVQTYAFFDEDFLRKLDWQPATTIALQNPVSENHYRLITSLVPNLLQTVHENKAFNNSLSFFELNAIWQDGSVAPEQKKSLAGIFYEAKSDIDFYAKKAILEQLLHELKLEVSYEKAAAQEVAPWYHPYKTMRIMHGKKILGYAGMAHLGFIGSLGGSAFIFELDAEYCMTAERSVVTYKPLHKYQDTWLDVSMLVPKTCTAESLKMLIKSANPAIFNVVLMDFFEKPEWHDQRSITMRYFARDAHKTLTGQEIDAIAQSVQQVLERNGAHIR